MKFGFILVFLFISSSVYSGFDLDDLIFVKTKNNIELRSFNRKNTLANKVKVTLKNGVLSFFDISSKRAKKLIYEINLGPLKLCEPSPGVFESWSFYKNSDGFLSIISEKASVTGNPYLKEAVICGTTNISGNVSVINSKLYGWGLGTGNLSVKGNVAKVMIENSEVNGFHTIETNVGPKNIGSKKYIGEISITNNSNIKGKISITSTWQPINLNMMRTHDASGSIQGSIDGTDSDIYGEIDLNGDFGKGILIKNDSTISQTIEGGKIKIKGDVTVDNATLTGDVEVSGFRLLIENSTLSGKIKLSANAGLPPEDEWYKDRIVDSELQNDGSELSIVNFQWFSGGHRFNNCDFSGTWNFDGVSFCDDFSTEGVFSLLNSSFYISDAQIQGNFSSREGILTIEHSELYGKNEFVGNSAVVNSELYNDHYMEGEVSLHNIVSKVSGVLKGRIGLSSLLKQEFNYPLDMQGKSIGLSGTFDGKFVARGHIEAVGLHLGHNVSITGLDDGGFHPLKLTNVTVLDGVEFSAQNIENNSDIGYRNCTIGQSGTQPSCLSKMNELYLH